MKNGIRFKVSENMVKLFSKLTGDLNPLHNDQEFARRTAYRQPIVQGMLIFSYVAFLTKLYRQDHICIPVGMKAQFREPVYFNQLLSLEIDSSTDNDASQKQSVDFFVKRIDDGTKVVSGMIEVQHVGREEVAEYTNTTADSSCMLSQATDSHDLRIEDISIGDTEQFQIHLNSGRSVSFIEILREGLDADAKLLAETETIHNNIYVPNLLALMALSTSVGIFNPGKFATFLGFDVILPGIIALNKSLTFSAEIINVSLATMMIKKEIVVSDESANEQKALISGHLHATVNRPPNLLPDMENLEQSGKDFGLKGKVALVTGASRGIGETIAKLLALHGAVVAVNYYQGEKDAQKVVQEIEDHGGRAIAVCADVRDEKQVQSMIDKIAESAGDIDILINNAVRDFKPSSFDRLRWDDVVSDIDVIVKGAFNCCKAVLPGMVARKAGKIINMGTVATENPPVNQTKYVMAKSALVGLTRSLSIEYAPKNVQVNMVVPNFVATDLVAHIPLPYKQKIEREMPMKRLASTLDIAKTVIFLASAYADYITGQKMMVTGGGAPYA